MPTSRFIRQTGLPVSAQEAFDFHDRPGAFERLVAPWRPVILQSSTDGIRDGSTVTILAPLGPLRLPWVFEHRGYQKGVQFQDIQLSGPFREWIHTHSFREDGSGAFLTDSIEYELPLGVAGEKINAYFFEHELDRLFRYRHNVTIHDLGVHARFQNYSRLSYLISGGSGLIGTSLCAFLSSAGHQVKKLRRGHPSNSEDLYSWNPALRQLSPAAVSGFDCIVHLGGSSIGASRWTDSTKKKILESRIRGTRLMSETLAKLPKPPSVFICASAIGYYGINRPELLDEASLPGESFLADVTKQWELATQPAVEAGIRVVSLRLGVVLSPLGGALSRMWLPFLLGMGGPLGDGKQQMSWISLHDVLAAIEHIAYTPSICGPVNLTSPNPVTNEQLSRTFATALGRPCALRVPASVLKLVFGDFAKEALLSSLQVSPAKLLESGFSFSFPEISDAIRMDLGVSGNRV